MRPHAKKTTPSLPAAILNLFAPLRLRRSLALVLSCALLAQSVPTPPAAAMGRPNAPGFLALWEGRLADKAAALWRAAAGPAAPAAARAQAVVVRPSAENFGVVLTPLGTPFVGHAGVGHHQPLRKVVVTANSPAGEPHSFETIDADGVHRPFSNLSGLTGAGRIATARDDGQGLSRGGFGPGELFAGTGAPGRIARVSADGASVQNPWVTLQGEAGHVSGLFVDRAGAFGGDLLAVTSAGGVWRVNSSGVAARVADLSTALGGVTTIPDDAGLYGPWAGKLLACAPEQGLVYAVEAQGGATAYQLGLNPSDVRVIPPHENFYGVDTGEGKVWGAPDDAFTSMIGDVLVAQGSPGVLSRVHWNGTEFEIGQVAQVGQWGQIAFSPAGVAEVAGVKQVYDKIAVVRHAPQLDSGRVEGALWQLSAENVVLDGTDVITSDLLVPGTPAVTVGAGGPSFGGVIQGVEDAAPSGYSVSISNRASLRHVITRTNPISIEPVAAPPAPAGTRDVSLTKADQSLGDPSTLRHLSVTGKAGAVAVPPGTYGAFSAEGRAALVFGVEGSAEPSVYNLESLALAGGSELRLAGPVVLNVRGGVSLAGAAVGAADNPRRLLLRVAGGPLAVTGNGALYGVVQIPSGLVTIEGNGRVRGTVTCDRLKVSGNGVLQVVEDALPPPPVNRPPTADAGPDHTITLPTDTVSLNGTASDDGLPAGSTLTTAWAKVSGPGPVAFADAASAASTASFSVPGIYKLRLKASDGLLTASDTVEVEVVPRNQPPTVNAGPDQTVELPQTATLAGAVADDALPRGASVTIQWSLAEGPGSVTFADPSTPATTAAFSAPGTYVLKLSADDTEFNVSDELVVTVYPENQPPTANAGPDQSVRLPAGVTLNGVTTDDGWPHGSTLTSLWSKVSGPGEVTFADARTPATTATFGAPGTYVLRLTADDTRATAADECTVEVLPANVGPTVDAGPDRAAALGANLLHNAGAEAPLVDNRLPGWGGEQWRPSPEGDAGLPVPAEGRAFFRYAGDSAEAELWQDVDISAFAAAVAGGAQQFEFSARARSAPEAAPDGVRVVVEYRDAANAAVLSTFDSGPLTPAGTWARVEDTRAAPAGAAWVRVRLIATRHTGATNDGYFDGLSLRAVGTAAVHLSGAAQDDGLPSGAHLAFAWSKTAGPGNVLFGRPEEPASSAVFDAAGAYSLQLFVTDSELSASDAAAVVVGVANRHPAAEAGADRSLRLAESLSLEGAVSDDALPHAGALTARWSKHSGPGEVTFADASAARTTATFSAEGTYVLMLSADDSEYASHDDVIVTVGPNNRAPTVNAGPDQTITLPAHQVTLGGTAEDDGLPPGSALNVRWSKISGPGEVSFADESAAATTASFVEPGTYVLRLTADDSEFTATDDLLVEVVPQNFPPTVNAGPDQTIVLTNPALLGGTYSDDGLPAGSTLAVSWTKVSGPGAATFENPQQEATTVTFGADGAYVLRLTVSDSQHTVSDELTINVVSPNRPPAVNAGPDQSVSPPNSTVRLHGSALDDGLPLGRDLAVAWAKVSGPGNVIFGDPASPITSATFTATGTYTLRLTASDSEYTASDDVVVTADCPPQLQYLDVVIVLDRSGSMSGQALTDAKNAAKTFIDFMLLEGDQAGLVSFESSARLDHQLTSNGAAVKAAIDALTAGGGTNIASGIVAAHNELISERRNPASTPVMIVLSDGGASAPSAQANAAKAAGIRIISIGLGSTNESVMRPIASSDSDYFRAPTSADLANVYASIAGAVCRLVNRPPTASAGPDQEITLPTNTVTLTGSFGDDGLPDGANFTVKWTKVSGPGTVTFSNPNAGTTDATFTGLTAAAVNTVVLRLTVSDSQFSIADDVTVTVQPDNFAPTVSAGADQTIQLPDDTVTLNGSVTDDGRPVGAPLTVTWSKVSGPGNVTFADPTQATTTATFSAAGSYTLRLSASDTKLTKTDTVVVTVQPDNFAPTVNAGSNQTVTLPNTVNLSGTASDDGKPAGSALTVSWSKVSGPGDVTFSSPNTLYTVASFSAPGSYTVRLTASDTQLTRTDDAVITVNAPVATNLAPSASAGPDQSITIPANTVTLTGAASDDGLPAGSTLTVRWTRVNGPGTVTFGSPDALQTTATFPVAGTYTLRLTASDSLLTKTDDVVVIVNPDNVAPTVNAGPNLTVTLPDNTVGINGSVTDDGRPVGAPLTVTWTRVNGPGAVTFGSPNSAVTTATFTVAGTYTLRLTASDSLLSRTDDVAVTVRPANQPPAVNAGPDQTVVFGANLLRNPGNEEPLAGGNIPGWTEVAGADWTQAGGEGFPASFDGSKHFYAGGSAAAELRQDVDVSAFAPSIAAGTQQFEFKARVQSRAEEPADTARIIIEYRNAANTAVLATLDSGELSSVGEWGESADARPAPAGTGWVRVRLIATRRAGATNDGYFDGLSLRPVLSAAARLNGTVTDDGLPTGSTLTVSWAKVSGPGSVTFSDPSKASTGVLFGEEGTYVLRLTANDTQLAVGDEVTVTVNPATATNLAPVANAGPDQITTLPDTADLSGLVHDDGLPAGAPLTSTWSAVSGPGSVTFADPSAPATTAAFSAPGTYVLRLTASDAELSGGDDLVVTVNPASTANQPPAVSAGPDQSITLPADTASLAGTATDDGLPAGSSLFVAWAKVSGPGSVTFGNVNAPATTAAFSAPGVYTLRLTASDSAFTRTDDVVVRAEAANLAPVVNAGADQRVNLPAGVTLRGSATDDGKPAGAALSYTWSVVAGAGAVSFADPHAATTAATFGAAGEYVLRLTASDTELSAGDELLVTVFEPVTGPAPQVAITSPADGSNVTTRTDVFGTVGGGAWRLEYALNSDAGSAAQVWTTIASGNAPVTNGRLGAIDPTLLLNGNYTFRLTATDASGQTSVVNTGVVAAGEQKVGNFTVSFTDLEVPVAGLPIRIVRTYDSRDKRAGDFGVGWTLDIKNVRVEKDGPVGRDWQQTVTSGFLPRYCLVPTRPHVVTVTFPEGKVYKFQAATNPTCSQLYPVTNAAVTFKPLPGDNGTQGASLVALDGGQVYVEGGPGAPNQLYDYDDLRPYNPTLFKLTTADGTSYVVDQQSGLRSMSDPNGNTLTVNANGLVHSSGRGVTFTRDAAGRITQIRDPLGNVMAYAYDAAGDLVSYRDREQAETTFAYNSAHGLVTIRDPRGNQAVRSDYDDEGRLVKHTDAFGNTTTYTRELGARRQTVTDRLGNVTVTEYDAQGNITKTVKGDGSFTAATYDARNNRLSETNALGKTTTYTYDAQDNRLTEADALGNVTRYTYNNRRQRLTVTDPRGGVTTNAFDASGNLASVRDPLGNVTAYTYTRGGLVASETDALGNVTRYEYDSFGNVTRETDAAGRATAYTYDAAGNRLTQTVTRTTPAGAAETLRTAFQYDRVGRLVKTTYPDGTSAEVSYNALGLESALKDQQGRTTTYEYDAMGRRTRITFPDGTKEETEYDAEGHRTRMVDRRGNATRFEYDGLGRLVKTIYPDGSTATSKFDALDRIVEKTDERGHTTRFEYDPNCGCSGRRAKVTDAKGQVTSYTYDENGNQLTMTDPRGQVTRFEYDALNRAVRVINPDGTSRSTGYDALGRVNSRTDEAGRTTSYEYDRLGTLTKVTDALGGVTTYAYDERGSLTSETDANGHTTRYEYDSEGRRTRRVLPLGMSETYAYDAAGRLSAKLDFNGRRTTYGYDDAGRMTSKTPDPALGQPAVAFTYTPTGHRATMADATGVTTYAYDERDRLKSKATPFGTLTYTYDAAGNVLTVRSSNAGGLSLDYAYDELNRLTTVTDNRLGAATSYAYDANGNLESTLYPNGVRTAYTYNTLNRLTRVEAAKDAPLASYTYTLGAAGNRLSVAEATGRTVTYTYDALYRLTAEAVAGDREAANNGEIGYAYDAAGNRLSRTSTVAAVAPASYAYDDNNRLAGDTFDANGNTRLAAGVAYAYDFEDRLVAAGAQLGYAYDGDGNRVSKTEGGATTHFLLDTNNPTGHPQVVEELAGGGVSRRYAYGHALISQTQLLGGAPATHFYGHDGQGSVRYLTDSSGAVTDTYTYDAFGNLLARTGSTPNDYLYTGEQFDAGLGFYYLRARYMNPATGRFHTLDTFEGNSFEPLSLHKYLYANADPVNNADPTGHMAMAMTMGGMEMHGRLQAMAALNAMAMMSAILLLLYTAGVVSTVQVPTLETTITRTRTGEQTIARARDKARADTNKARRRAGCRGNILFHYTNRIAALAIYATQELFLTRAFTDPAGNNLPRGAYATDIAPWTPMTQRELAAVFYFSERRQAMADVSWFVALCNDTRPPFVPAGVPGQWVNPGRGGLAKVNAFFAGPNPMP